MLKPPGELYLYGSQPFLSGVMVSSFDVVVVGAGPAGGHCARQMAARGHRVLLIERFKNFDRNSFSSAGTPMETLSQFDLPGSIVGSFWNQLVIVSSNSAGHWESANNLGAVLDFAKLRQFLADEVVRLGGELWLGCRYVRHTEQEGVVTVTIKNNLTQTEIEVQTKVLVDATGPARAITCRRGQPQPELITGTGLEYLLEVDAAAYERNAKALTFFLGHKWIPKGYSWIFPMEQNRLKVGAGILNQPHQVVRSVKPLPYYVDLLIQDYLQPEDYKILDIHGETLRYSRELADVYTEGAVLAIGDTVSTVNFLGGEGIRHAMVSAEVACRYIDRYLKQERPDFAGYKAEMHDIFLAKWKLSERLGMKKYIEDADALVDRVVDLLKPMSLEEIVEVLFYYRFEKVSKSVWQYGIRKIQGKIQQWFARGWRPIKKGS
jgi:digeranylgeranylglycerophospholipid reductase